VFENRVLRKIFGPKRDEVTGEWRKLHIEELRDLYSSPSIIRIIKSRRMRWAGHVAPFGIKGTERRRNVCPGHVRSTIHFGKAILRKLDCKKRRLWVTSRRKGNKHVHKAVGSRSA
jgi:hypothetical protein